MKKTILALFITTLFLLFTACQKGSIWKVVGKGDMIKKTIAVKGFTAISLNAYNSEVNYVQDSVFKVEVTAQENIHSVLETKLVDNVLRIRLVREVRSHNGLTVTVHAPAVNDFNVTGNGKINVGGLLKRNNAYFNVNGAGSVLVDSLVCENVDAKLSNLGNVSFKAGNTTNATYSVLYAGSATAGNFQTLNAEVNIEGSGGVVYLFAVSRLNVTINGSSEVRYKGNPQITKNLSNDGSLIHEN